MTTYSIAEAMGKQVYAAGGNTNSKVMHAYLSTQQPHFSYSILKMYCTSTNSEIHLNKIMKILCTSLITETLFVGNYKRFKAAYITGEQ